MTILHHPQFLQELDKSTVFLDTNVFSTASRNQDFLGLLVDLKNEADCALTTIPSVLFEVTNGSTTLEVYNERTEFVTSLVDAINPMKFMNDLSDFSVIMSKINAANKSYTDFLLAACLYNYRHAKVYLITSDLRALPVFFPRKHIITVEERSGNVKDFGVYIFDEVA